MDRSEEVVAQALRQEEVVVVDFPLLDLRWERGDRIR